MKALFAALFAVLTTALPVFAQSGSDPNRPPDAQNSARQASLHAAPSSAHAPSAGAISPEEQALFEHLNESRILTGLAALRWDAELAAAARLHCALLVQHEGLSHQFPGEPGLQQRIREAGAGFSALAENVALAATPDEIHYEWMHSPGHRANILDPQLTAVGISVMTGNKGLFAVQDFSRQVGNITMEQQEERVRELISATGVRTTDNQEHTQWSDARRTCLTKEGIVGRPAAVFRFETSDLSQLPDKLQASLNSRKYREAAVGACDPGPSNGFTRFRLAVLLY